MAEKDRKVRDRAWWVSNGNWLCHHVGGKGNWVHDSSDAACRHCGEPRPPLASDDPDGHREAIASAHHDTIADLRTQLAESERLRGILARECKAFRRHDDAELCGVGDDLIDSLVELDEARSATDAADAMENAATPQETTDAP